ncbi:MAG: hypothetical protein ACEQSA_03400 [Weeksellaceae bacterium]
MKDALSWSELEMRKDPDFNRRQLIEALNSNQPIYLQQAKMNGDDLIQMWYAHQLVSRFCLENNIQTTSTLENVRNGSLPGYHITQRVNAYKHANPIEAMPYLNNEYAKIARTLGIQELPEELDYVPRPIRVPFGALQNYDANEVNTTAQSLRVQTDGKKRIVIAQSGSEMLKRFSNPQVNDIVRIIKVKYPDAHITVVSDRLFVQQKVDVFRSYTSFPGSDLDFYNGLSESIVPDADELHIAGDNINALCARFAAADLFIGTDSYWAWLGAGSMATQGDNKGKITPNQAVVLHTRFDPEYISVPGATTVISPYLKKGIENGRLEKGRLNIDAICKFRGVDNASGIYSSNSLEIDTESIEMTADAALRILEQ